MTVKAKKNKTVNPEHWGFKESFLTFIPGNDTFRTMRSRNARHGVLFILPFAWPVRAIPSCCDASTEELAAPARCPRPGCGCFYWT